MNEPNNDTSAGTPARILAWLRANNPSHDYRGYSNRAVEHHIPEAAIAEFLADTEIAHIADSESTGQLWSTRPALRGLPPGYIALISDEDHWRITPKGQLGERTWLSQWITRQVQWLQANAPEVGRLNPTDLVNAVGRVAEQVVAYHGLILICRWGFDGDGGSDEMAKFPKNDDGEQLPHGGVYRWMSALDRDTMADMLGKRTYIETPNTESPQ